MNTNTPCCGIPAQFQCSCAERDAALKALNELRSAKPKWVVNSLTELGVEVGGRFYFLYKGESLVYTNPTNEDDGKPLMWRPVLKREFGECCHPPRYEGAPLCGIDDGHEWMPVPQDPEKK